MKGQSKELDKPENIKVIQSVSTSGAVLVLRSDGIVEIEFAPKLDFTVEIALEIDVVMGELAQGTKLSVLADARGLKPIPKNVQVELSKLKMVEHHSSLGIIVESGISAMAANIYMSFSDLLRPTKWIAIGILESKDTVTLSVTDSGAGIPSDIQDKILQPFFTTKPVGKGTGLGLSISIAIARNHHGQLSVDSNSKHNHIHLHPYPNVQSTADRFWNDDLIF